jgi:hypothetical protein
MSELFIRLVFQPLQSFALDDLAIAFGYILLNQSSNTT